jgi:metal-responsive CopG/Arc/MetJ family transcriptional regulator
MPSKKPRIQIYLDEEVLQRFQQWYQKRRYENASKAMKDVIYALLDGDSPEPEPPPRLTKLQETQQNTRQPSDLEEELSDLRQQVNALSEQMNALLNQQETRHTASQVSENGRSASSQQQQSRRRKQSPG